MPEPNPPILDYKTPEKRDPGAVGNIISRVIFGFLGLYVMGVAVMFSAVSVACLYHGVDGWRGEMVIFGLVMGGLAWLFWIFTIGILKYTIMGDRMIREHPSSSNDPFP